MWREHPSSNRRLRIDPGMNSELLPPFTPVYSLAGCTISATRDHRPPRNQYKLNVAHLASSILGLAPAEQHYESETQTFHVQAGARSGSARAGT